MFVIWYANIQINKAFCLKFQKLIVKHNRLVSLDHSKKTTERYRLIVNAKKRSIIDSFVDLIKYSDRRISAIIGVTKTIFLFERWFRFVSFQLTKAFVFTMIRLSHQIRSKSSRKHYIRYQNKSRIRNFVIRSEIRSLIISTRDILFVRESTRTHIY